MLFRSVVRLFVFFGDFVFWIVADARFGVDFALEGGDADVLFVLRRGGGCAAFGDVVSNLWIQIFNRRILKMNQNKQFTCLF